MNDRAGDRIRTFATEAVSAERLPTGATGLIAVGWATVDTDRAVRQLANAFGIAEDAFVAGPVSAALGARCSIAMAGREVGDIALVVIEPAAEGRLAAALARWDEGPVAAWYATADEPVSTRPGLPGPFGREWIVGADPLTGPHRLLVVSPPGTIAP
jgi:hypothetical protein